MGIDLVRGNEIFSVSSFFWGSSLDLAEAFGWTPAGTQYPVADLCLIDTDVQFAEEERRAREWPGSYIGSDWQRVTDADAAALADAITKAVAGMKGAAPITDARRLACLRMEENIKAVPTISNQPELAWLRGLLEERLGWDFSSKRSTADNLEDLGKFVAGGGFEIG